MKLVTASSSARIFLDAKLATTIYTDENSNKQTVYSWRVIIDGDYVAYVATHSRRLRDLVDAKWFPSKVTLGEYIALISLYEDGEPESEDMFTETTSVYSFDEYIAYLDEDSV
jgi:hypothetical protein